MKKIYLSAILLTAGYAAHLFAQDSLGPVTAAQRVEVCEYCASLQDAETLVLNTAAQNHLTGSHTVEVVNASPVQTWFVSYEYFPSDYAHPILDAGNYGTIGDNKVATAVVESLNTPVLVVIGPNSALANNPEFATQGNWRENISLLYSTLLNQLQVVTGIVEIDQEMIDKKEPNVAGMIYDAIAAHFGACGSTVTLVDKVGSTAQYCISPYVKNKVTYVKGSGRRADGSFYPLEFGDASNGSNYVQGEGLGHFGLTLYYGADKIDAIPMHLACGTVTIPTSGASGTDCYEVP